MILKCENTEEARKELSPEELESVTGGYLFNQQNIPGGGKDVWEVIDDVTGEVLGTTTDKNEALRYCKRRRLSTEELAYFQVEHLRYYHRLPKLH